MREFDHTGLLLAEFQGKLFEKSAEMDFSTPIFMRRFMHSNLSEEIDNMVSLSLNVNEGMRSIVEQYGQSNYGKEKYSKASLFWIGYMYRYISYTREKTTSFVMKTFSYKQMNAVYYSFHTQDPEWCTRNLLEINNLPGDYFDNNARLRRALRKRYCA